MEPRTGSAHNTEPLTQWDRLVRYISVEDQAVRYGEPIVSSEKDDITELAEEGKLQVKVCEGSDFLSMKPTSQTQTVKTLLGPLDPKDVPVIRCIGLNYKEHNDLWGREEVLSLKVCSMIVLEAGLNLPECPSIFFKCAPAVADHDSDIPIPKHAQQKADYEGELTIVIGKDAKNVSEDDALDFVAGYTVGNDVSARDWQMDKEKAGVVPQWSFSKGHDKYAPLGPCIVSSRILGEANDLDLKTTVNGEKRQHSNTADLCFGIKQLIAFCSQGTTLQKGSLIMTGTPSGVGAFMNPPIFLKHGDEVNIEIAKIGKLRNRMVFSDE